MEARVTFYGCSCGCTPAETKVITSETREGLLYGLANTILDYRVHSGNPYQKCNWCFTDKPLHLYLTKKLLIWQKRFLPLKKKLGIKSFL